MKKEEIDELFKVHYNYLLGFTIKTLKGDRGEALDLIHQLYLNLNRMDISLIENPRTYLCQGILNLYRNKVRKKHITIIDLNEVIMSDDNSKVTPEDSLMSRDRIELVLDFIDTLSVKQKAIAFDICKGIRMSNISKDNNIPYHTVKANWRHVAIKLKELLKNKGESFLWKVNI